MKSLFSIVPLICVILNAPEQVEILAANVEYGQGTNTTFTQIAAETCAIPAHWITVRRPDTGKVPDSGPTVASRTTMVVGRLVERASRMLLHPIDGFEIDIVDAVISIAIHQIDQ